MKRAILMFLLACCGQHSFSQGVKVGQTPGSPDPSAILEAQSTSQGLLPPRMNTAQRDAITNPAEGLHIYNTDTKCDNFFDGTNWRSLCGICMPVLGSFTSGTHDVTQESVTWNWGAAANASEYYYHSSNDFNAATSNGTSNSLEQTGLSCGSAHTLYVWAYNSCGPSEALVLTATTDDCCSEGTGGTITYASGKTIHTFTSSGTFVPGCAGNVEVLVVAGGGGGGSGGGGGGGAGGLLYDTAHPVTLQSYSVTVGDGGAGGNVYDPGSVGGNSVFDDLIALGGGGGGGAGGPSSGGGSGGGGQQGESMGGAGTPGQGNNGGNGTHYAYPYCAAGGGGAGSVGQNTISTSEAGGGGIGLAFSISGASVYYAGGGGGATWEPGTPGAAGIGGGGAGCSGPGCAGSPGVANTGGGGGGGGGHGSGSAGSGGSGVVIISYDTPE